MKKQPIVIVIKRDYKETPEYRKERVRNDRANRSCIHANKKAYKRHSKYKQDYDI